VFPIARGYKLIDTQYKVCTGWFCNRGHFDSNIAID